MAWNYERSLERVRAEYKRLKEADMRIIPLSREMNFDNLSPTACRLVHGAHLYADVPNMGYLVNDPTYKKEDYKRLVRCLHVMEREFIRIVEEVFDGYKIQFQGAKIHTIFHKPYQDDNGIAKNAVLAAITLENFIESVFNVVFEDYRNFRLGVGIDLGDVIVTNIGNPGDRELISLGSPANIAAKVQGNSNEIIITDKVFQSLPKDLKQYFEEKETDFGTCYLLKRQDWKSLFATVHKTYNINWDEEKSKKRIESDRDAVPLSEIEVHEAQEKIDIHRLSIRNNKTVVAAVIFVDVDGFTKYVIDAEKQHQQQDLVRIFHLLRYELRDVVVRDYEGVRIQYQGDRLQAIFHVPANSSDKVCQEAVEAAIGCQSSMEDVIPNYSDYFSNLHVAIGCDIGKILVTRLGKKGDLDVICLGNSVYSAETLQVKAQGTEIAISANVYQKIIDDTIKKFFEPNSSNTAYAAKGLTWEKVWAARRATDYDLGKGAKYIVAGESAGKIVSVNHITSKEESRIVKPTRPWGYSK